MVLQGSFHCESYAHILHVWLALEMIKAGVRDKSLQFLDYKAHIVEHGAIEMRV